jgi:hypothetical protein
MQVNKQAKFRRLAKQRGDRILKDMRLLGNLSNTNNYAYTEDEVKKLFSTIDEELKYARSRFYKDISKYRKIDL